MMGKKLIFIDIDGTLTPPGGAAPPDSAAAAIKKARENGHIVFICTGRNPVMIAPLMRYGFDGAVGCAGGFVTCGGEVIYDHPMTDAQRDASLDSFGKSRVFRILECRDATYGDEDTSMLIGPGMVMDEGLASWMSALTHVYDIRPICEYDGRPIYKIVFMCRSADQLSDARGLLEDQFSFCLQPPVPGAPVTGELINRDFDKGRAVLRVCEHLGINVSDTVAFGDSMNDLEMLQTAGLAVCMGNGDERLKPHADMVCPSVHEDGLAWAFDRLGLA